MIKSTKVQKGNSPDDKLAAEKTLYLNSINEMIALMGLKQGEAAAIMDITQPRVSNIAKCRLEKFTLDFLFLAEDKLKIAFMTRKPKKRAA